MYAHRGAYLQALAMAFHAGLDPRSSRILWTLPMFHCNGWCFPWAVTAAGAAHVCLRQDRPGRDLALLREEGITHFNAAPTVLTCSPSTAGARPVADPVRVATGGAPPSPALLARMAELNIVVTHLYGLTETYGPAVICDWQPEWNDVARGRAGRLKARQGVRQRDRPTGPRVVDADGAATCPPTARPMARSCSAATT